MRLGAHGVGGVGAALRAHTTAAPSTRVRGPPPAHGCVWRMRGLFGAQWTQWWTCSLCCGAAFARISIARRVTSSHGACATKHMSVFTSVGSSHAKRGGGRVCAVGAWKQSDDCIASGGDSAGRGTTAAHLADSTTVPRLVGSLAARECGEPGCWLQLQLLLLAARRAPFAERAVERASADVWQRMLLTRAC